MDEITCTAPNQHRPEDPNDLLAASPEPESGRYGFAVGLAHLVGHLTALVSAAVGSIVGLVAFCLAIASFDGATLFGCSDGYKHPDPRAGVACLFVSAFALLVGWNIARTIERNIGTSKGGRA
jgi:hypothetical protein